MTRLYVGNLPYSADEAAVRNLFSQHGNVEEVDLIHDRQTGRFRGFGFVQMPDAEAGEAMKQLDGQEMDGRTLRVSEARQRSGGSPRD